MAITVYIYNHTTSNNYSQYCNSLHFTKRQVVVSTVVVASAPSFDGQPWIPGCKLLYTISSNYRVLPIWYPKHRG